MFKYCLILIFCLQVQGQGVCEQCDVTGVACVSATTFKICSNGAAIGSAQPCPSGYVCVSDQSEICVPHPQSTFPPTCDNLSSIKCGICLGGVACQSATTYTLCSTGSTTAYACPTGMKCDPLRTNGICSETATACVSGTDQPSTLCKGLAKYPDPTVTGCKGYVRCTYATNGTISIARFLCPGTTIYNQSTMMCTTGTC